MPNDEARAWLERLRPGEHCGDVLDLDEQTLHRFPDDGEEVDLVAAREVYAGETPPLIEPAYVDGRLELMELGDPASSPNYPFLVVLDRAVAIPEGIDLLRGRACRVLNDDSLERLDADLDALGAAILITRVVPHIDRWGNGLDDAREGLTKLRAAIADAREQKLALLLVGMIVP